MSLLQRMGVIFFFFFLKLVSKCSGLLEHAVVPKLLRLNGEFCINSKMSVWTIPQNSVKEENCEVP